MIRLKIDDESSYNWWEEVNSIEIPEKLNNIVDSLRYDSIIITEEQLNDFLEWAENIPGGNKEMILIEKVKEE